MENEAGTIDPEVEEAMEFLNELYDEEFDEAVFELVSEANELYQDRFEGEYGDPMRAFRGDSLVMLIDPRRVSPEAFAKLEQKGEAALYTLLH